MWKYFLGKLWSSNNNESRLDGCTVSIIDHVRQSWILIRIKRVQGAFEPKRSEKIYCVVWFFTIYYCTFFKKFDQVLLANSFSPLKQVYPIGGVLQLLTFWPLVKRTWPLRTWGLLHLNAWAKQVLLCHLATVLFSCWDQCFPFLYCFNLVMKLFVAELKQFWFEVCGFLRLLPHVQL